MFRYVPHPHVRRRKNVGPAKVADQHDRSTTYARFNTALAVTITASVGSMTCAYVFAVLALFGLPAAIQAGIGGIVQWIAQTFLQLVLLSIIIVGQNVQAQAADKRAADTFADAEAILHEATQIQAHLQVQDDALTAQMARLKEQDAQLAALLLAVPQQRS